MSAGCCAAATALPDPADWQAAAEHCPDLFEPLDGGARVGLIARAQPHEMLFWELAGGGVRARIAPFVSWADSGCDIALSADEEALAAIRAAGPDTLFAVLRGAIRSGHVVCYILRRRCQLEERGFEELLTELGFAFMGACR